MRETRTQSLKHKRCRESVCRLLSVCVCHATRMCASVHSLSKACFVVPLLSHTARKRPQIHKIATRCRARARSARARVAESGRNPSRIRVSCPWPRGACLTRAHTWACSHSERSALSPGVYEKVARPICTPSTGSPLVRQPVETQWVPDVPGSALVDASPCSKIGC